MKELDGLREALGSTDALPWKVGEILREPDGSRRIEVLSPSWVMAQVVCKYLNAEPSPEEKSRARAIVLSVNLAPLLLRVAEAADRVNEDCEIQSKGFHELNEALESLRSATRGTK